MGGMSASDAAPLPRLGEVFFDVRGDSRSMRLSWYADTGVAVLSIWQGGMCTGTFRLAIADLPRMVETLQRGPRGPRQEWDPEAPGEVFAQVPRVARGAGQAMEPPPDQRRPEYAAEQAEYRTPSGQYQTGPYQPARHQAGRRQTPAHAAAAHAATGHQTAPRQPARHQTAPYPAEAGGPLTGPAGPPDHRAASSHPLPAAPEYLAELPDDPRAGATPRPPAPPDPLAPPPEYLPAPPGPLAAPPEYLPAPPDQLTAVQPGQRTGIAGYQDPLDQRTEYLEDLPGTGPAAPAGYDAVPGSLRAGYPSADASGPYPPGAGLETPADDPYLGGTGPMDYPDPHSPPGPGDAGGADYAAHYGGAVTDDILPGPALDSTPHDRPQGRRRAASRHAAPDVPSD
jgi:hypothetical protein